MEWISDRRGEYILVYRILGDGIELKFWISVLCNMHTIDIFNYNFRSIRRFILTVKLGTAICEYCLIKKEQQDG